MQYEVKRAISDSISTKQAILNDPGIIELLVKTSNAIIQVYKSDGSFLAAGNGGSAADSQHMVAELIGRFNYDRPPLRAFALNANSSNLTCIGNDYGYDQIFSRQIEAIGKNGDLLLAISTSGNSKNIIRAVESARKKQIICVGLTGSLGGQLTEICDWTIRVPSVNTARIQESHIMICHIICELVEAALFPQKMGS